MSGVRSSNNLIANTVISAAAGYIIDLNTMHGFAVEVDAVVNSTAKTAVDNKQATEVIGTTVTYTATTSYLGAAGNAITIAFVAGGTAGAEVVTVVGTAISVSMDTTAVTGSTGTQIKTAIAASAAAAALVTGSGTAAAVQSAQAATALSGGVTSKFDLVNDTIAISAHGYFTGQVVRATTSSGSLPTGLSTSTDYFVIVQNTGSIKLASTLALALAGTSDIDITAYGTDGSTITFTPTAISGVSYKLQKSNSYDPRTATGNFIDLVAGETNSVVTNTITVSANSMAGGIDAYYRYAKVLFAIAAGTVAIKVYASAKEV